MGLLLTHKRTLRIWGDMLSVSVGGSQDRSGGGKRGDVKVFSRDSRYRLFRALHQLRFEKISFVTLTYPADFPVDPRVYKGHLKEWRRRFEKKYGKVPAIWRLEFQERGAPHFHIMYLDCPFADVHEMCWTWKSITHTWDMAHELVGVDVKLVVDGKEQALIAFYLGKYIAKVDERSGSDGKTYAGRWWGRWNITDIPPREVEITDREAERIVTFALSCRLGRQSWQPLDPTVCTVFGDSMGNGFFGDVISGFTATVRRRD